MSVFQELDLSNNYLDNLPGGLFRDMANLTRLTLHNNSLTVMDRELFQVIFHSTTLGEMYYSSLLYYIVLQLMHISTSGIQPS